MWQKKKEAPEGVVETLEKRIDELKKESGEHQFDAYLERTAKQFSAQKNGIEVLSEDLERNYKIYQERMERKSAGTPEASHFYGQGQRQMGYIPQQLTGRQRQESIEYKIGAGVFGIVGFLFIMAAVMMFGMTYIKGNVGFIITAGIVFAANFILLLLPIKRGRYVSNLVQLAGTVIITWILTLVSVGEGIPGQLILLYVISSIIIIEVLFLKQKKDAVNITLFCVCLSALGILYLMICTQVEQATVPVFALLASVCLCFFFFGHEHKTRWIQYWFLSVMIFLYTLIGFPAKEYYPVPFMTGVIIVFISAKLLSRVKILYVSEIIITVVTALCGLYYYGGRYGILFMALFVLSVLAIHHDKLFYELLTTAMCVFYFIRHPFLIEFTEGIIHYEIFLAGTVSVLLISMICYNLMKPLRVQGIHIFNYACLALMALLYTGAFLCTNYVVYAVLTVVGILTILVVLREPFGIRIKFNSLLLGIFMAYMVLVLRIPIPVLASICLIVIAVISVIIGFVARRKESRIFGLALSVFVCLKVVFYDFMELPAQDRMVLFLVVGLIILAIAVIYILLEKRLVENQGQTGKERGKGKISG